MGLRVAFLCMESVFSVRPLEAVLEAGHDVRFVMRPIGGMESRKRAIIKRHRGFDVAVRRAFGLGSLDDARHNPLTVAAREDVPAWLVGNASSEAAVSLLKKERVDVVVVAFFNQLLKRSFLEATPLGAINLHPSLLPRYRGPAPLFWTFRDGCEETGLTLHRIAPGEDNGDILLQERVALPFDLAGEELVDDFAQRAARMAVTALAALESGAADPRQQDEAEATRAPRPTQDDLRIDRSWGARRIFQFVRGVGRWNPVYVDSAVDGRIRVVDAVELMEKGALPGDAALIGDLLHLACDDGVVVLRTRASAPS